MTPKVLARTKVSVPASTSNLGPGFDCLGLALDLRNDVVLELVDERGPTTVDVHGEGAGLLPTGEKNLVVRAARLALPKNLPGRLRLRCDNRIPMGRGLGSSGAATVAGLWAGAHLFGTLRRSEDELEELAVRMEGHPDNAVPCIHGGLTASLFDGRRVSSHRLEIHPSLSSSVCIPNIDFPTKKARAVLPRTVTRADAVFNIARIALLPRALATAHTGLLHRLMEDRLHQERRFALAPGLSDALAAALRAGAVGAAVSGAGPSAFAFVDAAVAAKVGAAMSRAFARHRIKSRWLALSVDHKGVRVEG
jgi:homoserine kinase